MTDDKRDTTLDHLPQQVREIAEETRRFKEEIRLSQQESQLPDAPEPEARQDEEAQAQPEPETPPADEWKRKHDALFGKYSTEIGQARAKIRDLEAEVARLTAAASAPKEEKPPVQQFDAGAYADYDAPIQELATTVARLEEELRSKEAVIASLSGQMQPLQQSVAQREYEAFLSGVASKVPNLDALNTDPDFLAWLNEPNPYDPSGGSFGDTLRAAESRRNVEGVARIFNDFAATSGKYAQPQAAKPASPRPKNVQPSSSSAAPVQPDKGRRTWTVAAIEQFYRDVAQGRYAGREEEVRAVKKEIYMADQQGLVA